jgi:tetratricopeptide (TPR) repeat protein
MSRPRIPVRLLLALLAGGLVFALGGCGDGERSTYATELDEPSYREGQSLLKAGRRQEALTAFLKVIDKRRDDAPESHLEVGLLYAQHINDPLSAIYHFRKYLALRPNSPQAPLVRQRIDAAIREFARTIPAQPLESQLQRVDLVATLDKLKQENDALKQQLAELKAARGQAGAPPAPTADGAGESAVPAPVPSFNFSVETMPTVRTRAPAGPPVVQTRPAAPPTRAVTPAAPPRQASPPPTATGVRKHLIRPGDTLSKLAQQYYGNRARWRDIYAANRDVMKNEGDLKVGTEIKIP